MPYINKPKTYVPRDRIDHLEVYNKQRWKKLRTSYLQVHPLCEQCEKNGRTTLATECHHRREILSGNTTEERQQLAFDWNNIQALCHDCHVAAHKELKKIRRNPR